MMEMFSGLDPESIMKIPSTRRYRLILKKSQLEEDRRRRREAEESAARARMNSRR
jgi:hypothetical protein